MRLWRLWHPQKTWHIKMFDITRTSEWVSVSGLTSHSTQKCHFVDVSFPAIHCMGTDNQTTTKRKYTKHEITNPNTTKLALIKNKNTQNLNLNSSSLRTAHISVHNDCAPLCYTIQHGIVLIIFPVILQTITIAPMSSNGWHGRADTDIFRITRSTLHIKFIGSRSKSQ